MDDAVHSLEVFEGNLIAGGQFIRAGGNAANRIASWDGASWSSLGDGVTGPWYFPVVYSLASHAGIVVAGGYFMEAGGNPAEYIAGWDGASWHELDGGLSFTAYALSRYGGTLVTAGGFTTAGNLEVNHIATWGGSAAGAEEPRAARSGRVHMPNPYRVNQPITLRSFGEGRATAIIYDFSGKIVKSLPSWYSGGGRVRISWDGKTESGQEAGSGIYFLRLRTGTLDTSTRLTLVK
jgi:hypothetical protein